MRSAAVAVCCHVDFARISLCIGDKLGNGFGGDGWMNQDDARHVNHGRDRGDVAYKVEIKLLIECRVDGVRWIDQQQRVAVRSSTHDRFSGNVTGSTWPVLDNEWLAEPLG